MKPGFAWALGLIALAMVASGASRAMAQTTAAGSSSWDQQFPAATRFTYCRTGAARLSWTARLVLSGRRPRMAGLETGSELSPFATIGLSVIAWGGGCPRSRSC